MSREEPRRRPGRPRDERLDEAILDAALAELERVGYARLRMEAVAQRAGTTKPSLYARYRSKAALATAALESMRLRTPRPRTGELRRDLVEELRRFRSGALRPHGMTMLGTVLAEEHETPELLRLFREHLVAPRRAILRAILQEGVERGRVRADADVELGITMLLGSLIAAYLGGDQPGADWPERVVDAWLQANEVSRRSPPMS